MNKIPKFKVIVEVSGKEVASTVLGYDILVHIGRASFGWNKPGIYADMHPFLVQYPHPEIWREVALIAQSMEVCEILLAKPDFQTVANLASNQWFMERVSEKRLLEMVDRDASVAVAVARNIGFLKSRSDATAESLECALQQLKNYELDYELAANSASLEKIGIYNEHCDRCVSCRASID